MWLWSVKMVNLRHIESSSLSAVPSSKGSETLRSWNVQVNRFEDNLLQVFKHSGQRQPMTFIFMRGVSIFSTSRHQEAKTTKQATTNHWNSSHAQRWSWGSWHLCWISSTLGRSTCPGGNFLLVSKLSEETFSVDKLSVHKIYEFFWRNTRKLFSNLSIIIHLEILFGETQENFITVYQ